MDEEEEEEEEEKGRKRKAPEAATEEKKKREKKVYDLPGQKKDPPEKFRRTHLGNFMSRFTSKFSVAKSRSFEERGLDCNCGRIDFEGKMAISRTGDPCGYGSKFETSRAIKPTDSTHICNFGS
ncbi:uncharacterized protein LOC125473962 isoform X2 [Pyrus x bretschneideri]|nr:uncharacterized protein LOC125473962 isoform X2 [Pyrus x bretschneideri]XP_048433345.1 uncharacterized protein LOC125473962 isoform X2 [Pyrus x bretschneideri]